MRGIEKTSLHFHHIKKGCDIVPKRHFRYEGQTRRSMHGAFCLTHKQNICRCGWSYKYHFGIYLPGLPNHRHSRIYPKLDQAKKYAKI